MESQRPKSMFSHEYKVLAYTMRSLRIKAGVIQKDVAKAMGWTQSDVSKRELAKVGLDPVELRRYCHSIGIDFPQFALVYEKNLTAGLPAAKIKKQRTY